MADEVADSPPGSPSPRLNTIPAPAPAAEKRSQSRVGKRQAPPPTPSPPVRQAKQPVEKSPQPKVSNYIIGAKLRMSDYFPFLIIVFSFL